MHAHTHFLKELDFNNNQITQTTAKGIFEVITSNSKMEKLSMRNNDIKLKGLLIICKGLRKLST